MAFVVVVLVCVGIGVAILKGKLPLKGVSQKQEEGTEMVQMAALGETACDRDETCFGCPPDGPDVPLGLDPNRCDGGVCSLD